MTWSEVSIISTATLISWILFSALTTIALLRRCIDRYVAVSALSMGVSEIVFYVYVIGRQASIPLMMAGVRHTGEISRVRSLTLALLAIGVLAIAVTRGKRCE